MSVNYTAECPHCKGFTYIHGATSLFRIFKCYCGKRFRGIHARCTAISNFGFDKLNLRNNWNIEYATTCPNYCRDKGCFRLIGIAGVKQGDCCERCGIELPIQPAIQESNDPWDEDDLQDYYRQKAWEESPEYAEQQLKEIEEAQKIAQQNLDMIRENKRKKIEREEFEREERRKARKKERIRLIRQTELDDLVFWNDHLAIALNRFFLKESSIKDLKSVKDQLLNKIIVSDARRYRLALQGVERALIEKIKKEDSEIFQSLLPE